MPLNPSGMSMMKSMTLFSLFYLWFIFYEGDSIYSLSTYNTPCFLSNLVSFYAPFGPLSDEISMDGADSHEEPPSNQQWNLVLNVRGRFTWLFLCKSDPRHICLSFLIIFPIKIVFTSGLFSCLVWYIGCHQVEAACEIILRCRPTTRTWLSNCFSVWFLFYWLLISYYLNFFGLWFMNMSSSFRLSGVIFCNIWYSMLNCLVIVQGFKHCLFLFYSLTFL